MLYDFDSGLPENNVLELNEAPSDLGLGDDEVMMATGDSGGPVFLDGAIAGISTSYLGQQPGDATPDANSSWGEMAHRPPRVQSTNVIEQATQGKARFVPEPTTTRTAILALLSRDVSAVAIVVLCQPRPVCSNETRRDAADERAMRGDPHGAHSFPWSAPS